MTPPSLFKCTMSFEQLLQYVLSGITNGSIYAIVAIGFNIIYNTTGIINFAQGEFLMLGGMTAISLSAFMPLPLAILAAVVITSFAGALIDFLFIRRLRSPSVLNMVIVTVGLSIVIREIALHIWDEKVRSLPYFTGNEITSINILGAFISPQVLWVLGISSIIVVFLGVFFKFTLTGRSMRACASNITAARLCGINARNMVTISFMLSAAIGALAGCVVSPITQTQYDCGTSLAIKGFTVAILGGLGNSTGAVIGGLIIGLLEAFSISILPLAYKDAIAIAILLIILFVRPSGLLGKKEAAGLKEF
jgi:branched-chain amino acid transport system permease protein